MGEKEEKEEGRKRKGELKSSADDDVVENGRGRRAASE